MIQKAQWIAMHRHDIPISGDWSGFSGIVHGGYRRQDAIERIREILESYGAERVLLYEHRPAQGTVSVRRTLQG